MFVPCRSLLHCPQSTWYISSFYCFEHVLPKCTSFFNHLHVSILSLLLLVCNQHSFFSLLSHSLHAPDILGTSVACSFDCFQCLNDWFRLLCSNISFSISIVSCFHSLSTPCLSNFSKATSYRVSFSASSFFVVEGVPSALVGVGCRKKIGTAAARWRCRSSQNFWQRSRRDLFVCRYAYVHSFTLMVWVWDISWVSQMKLSFYSLLVNWDLFSSSRIFSWSSNSMHSEISKKSLKELKIYN